MPTVQFKDYYKTLGLSKGAATGDIKAAYRKLAKQYHPDKNPGDAKAEERFKEINEANEVLADPEKRKLYDRYGEAWRQYKEAGFTGDEPAGRRTMGSDDFATWFARQDGQPSARQSAGSSPFGTFRTEYRSTDGRGFSDFFQTLFGGLGGRDVPRSAEPVRQRGTNLEVGVDVSFDEAYRGSTRTFDVQSDGICPTCGGVGYVRENPCPTCDGTGHTAQQRLIEVKIPAGVATGSKIRVKGKGNPGTGGAPDGDIIIIVNVKPDPRFERIGDDLRTDVEVPLYAAVLGGEVVVPTPTSRLALMIPPETQNGRIFRLRGKGMPRMSAAKKDGDHGDLLARVKVVIPTDLSAEEREHFRKLAEIRQQAPSA